MKVKASLALKEYNNGMKLRALLRITTSIQWRVDGDYVPDRVRFRLVESLVDDALDKLRGGLALDEEIELDSDNTCRNAVLCCTWLNSTCWPYTPLVGFGFDLTCNNLFCFRDSAWLNDNAMRAFFCGFVASHQFVLLPINVGGTHRGCLVVDRDTKVIKMYDSMGGKRNKKRLQKMAEEIRTGPLRDDSYEALEVTEPVQTDSDSCGVFVCRFFWTCVSSESPSDVSPACITKLRWEMLHAVMKLRPR
ncbi:cysteine protease family C48, putative [Phytophthora infestans T30-4]|uniref:Cysteine protease family C48, putative n=1 Tax=Phytophthora infestans (strain T30-4) TaxID=403677 RepID=D0NRB9_PHYIT|nr:cysteine protease family C48, putative [Phytophthora infestans T30-4]EEY63241.1 cysteine protease family C48, putative [Phytophthora infestans T30-4]|eukprot:XP_002898418.1 cysteine protease family C48, putative [Phytophthora infestans T30-4]